MELIYLVLEQIICLSYVQYLRYVGIKIYSKKKNIPIEKVSSWCIGKNTLEKLSIYKKDNTFFFRIKYPLLSAGPCVCAAMVKSVDSSTIVINVKMCPFLFFIIVRWLLMNLVNLAMGDISIDKFSPEYCLSLLMFFCSIYLY